MPRRASDVAKALEAKGMTAHNGRHHVMYRKKLDGVTTLVSRMSHSHDTISDGIGKLMANQCALQLREFWQLIDCSLDERGWDKLVAERCKDGRNPFLGN